MRGTALRWSITGEDMDGSYPERIPRWPLITQAALVGAALGVLAMVGGGVFLADAGGLVAASVGVIVTIVAALGVGLWAGAPGAAAPPAVPEDPGDLEAAFEPRLLRGRWFAAGLITGAAGIFATLWEAFPGPLGSALPRAIALLMLVAAPVYTLGLLLPSLLAWAEEWHDALADDHDLGRWEPLGTLVIALLAGLALAIAVTGLVLIPYLGAGPVLLGTGAVLILPTLLPEPTPPRTDERVIFATESALNTIRVVEVVYPGKRQPERRLYVNDEEESGELVRSGAPTLPYIAAGEQWFADTSRRGDAYLFLGGGAYTLPRRVAERDASASITVVELDPEVTRVAYRFFGMKRHYGIQSVHGDARAYIEQAEARFDRIFVDVYGGQEALPHSLVTREAFELLERLLRPGGVLTLNAIGVTDGRGERRFWSLVRTLTEVFPAVALYTHLGRDHPERQNVLLAASPDPDHAFPPRAGMFEPWPRDEWPDAADASILRDLYPTIVPTGDETKRTPAERVAGE
jgi:predicted O-methyltransferase YrrM